ncbi:MAG: hypothetical protein AUG46_06220 [Acidobacteria bacterium 13_1_20CM_3_58_11]|nr:MAG: hypothetical protein AUG46_06220 [Acidobacteria bacterium 13_1_20CM_3_58_11]
MSLLDYKIAGAAFLIFLGCAPGVSLTEVKRDKSVWNYDGGVFFETDGSLPNGVCFRVSGNVTSPEFFDHLKRIDDGHGTVFRRGLDTVTQFPDQLLLSFVIHDQSCSSRLHEVGTHIYLTREMMGALQLSLYWKRGVDLRQIQNVTEIGTSVERIIPYATDLASELPQRLEWSYQLAVVGKGIPLTDSLVFVFRTRDERIAARVAARL